MNCHPPTSAKVTEFSLDCPSRTLYLETKTPDGKIKIFEVDLTPLFTGCDGEDLFPLVDTRLANPTVTPENQNGEVRVDFEIINSITQEVLGHEFFYIPVTNSGTNDHINLLNIGINTHDIIDVHLADVTSNPHNVTYGNIGGTQPAPVPHDHDAGTF